MYNHFNTGALFCQEQLTESAEKAQLKTLKKVAIKKAENVPIIRNLITLGETERAAKINECGTFLDIQVTEDLREHVLRSNFCRQRLCQVCAWRRQLKFYATTAPALEKIACEKRTETSYIFVTLTLKNCRGKFLKNQLTHLLKSYEKLTRRKELKPYLLGGVRSLECTYSVKSNTYHPHIHAILLVSNNYFNQQNIITHDKLVKLWKSCTGAKYDPWVHIEKIRDKHGNSDTEEARTRAALETIKYAIKMKDVATSPEVLKCISNALHGRRLVSFSGLIAKTRKELGYEENIEDCKLTDDKLEATEFVHYMFTLNPNGFEIVQ